MSRDPAEPGTCNRALRLAFAVAVGLTAEILRGALLPPLAPVIALQILAFTQGPPAARMVGGLFGAVAVSALAAYGVAVLTVGNAALYALGVGLVYLWGFWLAARPATAAMGMMALTMGIVVTGLSAASTGLAIVVVGELLVSVLLGIGLVYLAHAAFPGAAEDPQPSPAQAGKDPVPADRRALLATLVILPLHLWLTAEGIAAFVVLLTVATMLRQPGIAQSLGYGLSFACGNIVGGLVASAAVLAAALQPGGAVLAAAVSAGAIVMAWLLALMPRRAPVLLPGLVAYTLLFGLAHMAGLPTGEVALLDRVALIAFAAVYATGAIALAAPFATRRIVAASS